MHGQATDQSQDERDLSTMLERSFPEFLIDSLPCSFFVISQDGRFIRWNRNFQVMSEYSDQEIGSMRGLDAVVEEQRGAVADALRQAFDDRMPQMEVACRTKSGRVVPLFVTTRRATIAGAACLVGTGWDATRRTLAEQRLADEHNLLSTVIDNLPDAIYVKDRESRFVLCNREVLRRKAVGSMEEIVGRTDFDFYPPDRAQSVYAGEQDVMRTGRPIVNLERCVVDKVTGRPTWNLTTKLPLRNLANEIVGIVGIGRDITERKQAEEAYHAIVDHSLQGLFIIQDMRVVFANEAMAKISGYTAEEMRSMPPERLPDFIHPLDREIVWRNHQARLSGDSLPEQYEFRVVRKDGSIRWLEINTSRVEYQGRPAIQAACIDTTERRRAEEALRRSEARNLALLDANPDLMFRLSRDGVFLDCRPPKDDAVSLSPAQFVGRPVDEVFPAAVAQALLRHIQAAIESGHVQTLEYSLEDAQGENCDFECRLVACNEQEVVAIVRDISDRRRAENLAKVQRDMAIRLSNSSDLKDGLQYCLEMAIKASHMDCGGIYTLDEHSGSLRLVVHQGLSDEFIAYASVYPAGSRNTRIVLEGEPVYAAYDKLGMPIGPAQKAERLWGVGIIPIKHDKRVVACLNVASHTCGEAPRWSRVVLEAVAAQIGNAISRLKIQEALQRAEQEKAVILNTLPQIVTYHDISHRILWVNQIAVDALKMTVDEIVGHHCYELWEGAAVPCAGCPVDRALRTGCSQEAEITGYNGGTWLVRGEPVRDGAGRLLGVVEMALEITERKRAEEKLRERVQFDGLVASVSTDFANLPVDEIDAGVGHALAQVGQFAGVDRSFIYMIHDGGVKVSRRYEWCAEGVESYRDNDADIETGPLSWSFRQVIDTGILDIPRACQLDGAAAATRRLLESAGAKSLLVVPVRMGGRVFGFLGLSHVRSERPWSEDVISLLKIIADLVANALTRKRAADLLNERLAFETLLSNLSAAFVNLPVDRIDGEIERWLGRIGEVLGIDRTTIFQFAGARATATHSWAAPGLTRTPPGGRVGDFNWGIAELREGRVLAYARVDDMPAQAAGEKEYCRRQGIQSVISIPLEETGAMLGAIAFSSVRTQRDWSEELIRRLRLVAQVFTHAMSRRRAERAMQETERKLRTLLANLPGLAYRCANVPDWAFEFVSEGALPLTGYTPQEITVGGTVSYGSLIHPDDRQIVWDTVQEAVHRDASFDLEYRIRTKDGKERWVFERGRAVPSPHGQSPVLEGFIMDITERRRAEAALRESESRFRDLADLLPQTVFETDARGFFTFANRSGLEQFRYTEHEVSSVSVAQVVAPDDRERAVQNLQQKLTGRPTASNEYMAIRKDGSTFPALLYSSPILRDGSPAGLRGILIDITERYRAEMALRESEKKYRDLYEGSRDGFAEVDDQMRLVECNSVFLEMIGYSKEEILGRTLQEITPSRWHGAEERISREQIHARGYSDVYEKEYVRKDGSVFPAEVRAYAIRDTAGRHCGVWAVVRDITARKHAETALRASEQNYREIFNAVNDAILIQDPDTGAVLDVNRTVLDVYGYTYEEAMHLKLGETGVPEPSRAAQEAMARVRRVAHEGPQLFEWLSRKKNGDPIWEEVNLRIASIGGKRRVLAVIRDITDRKKAEIQAQQHLAELTRAWHANMLGEMASGLAHELNQPLCAVVNYSNGCLRLIRKEGYAIETVRNSIEQIAAQAQRAADIIKRIRALVAKRDPQRTRIDLSGIINGAVQMLREEADKHNVAMVSKGQEKRPAVKGDGVEIEQVVLNLMRNAIEAMNDPLVSRRVLTISNQVRDGRMIEIAVADTGRGIPPELSEKIFDSFFTTKAEGLGIGLSLSRRIVESHGGRLWAESDGRSGATFRFTLPVEGGTHGEG